MIGLIRGIAQGCHLSIAACPLVGKVFCCEHLKRLEEIFRFVRADFEVTLEAFNGGSRSSCGEAGLGDKVRRAGYPPVRGRRMTSAATTARGAATMLPAAKIVESGRPTRSCNGPIPNAATP